MDRSILAEIKTYLSPAQIHADMKALVFVSLLPLLIHSFVWGLYFFLNMVYLWERSEQLYIAIMYTVSIWLSTLIYSGVEFIYWAFLGGATYSLVISEAHRAVWTMRISVWVLGAFATAITWVQFHLDDSYHGRFASHVALGFYSTFSPSLLLRVLACVITGYVIATNMLIYAQDSEVAVILASKMARLLRGARAKRAQSY